MLNFVINPVNRQTDWTVDAKAFVYIYQLWQGKTSIILQARGGGGVKGQVSKLDSAHEHRKHDTDKLNRLTLI